MCILLRHFLLATTSVVLSFIPASLSIAQEGVVQDTPGSHTVSSQVARVRLDSTQHALIPLVTGVPGGLPRLVSDTGRMQPAYLDLSRYTSPGMCISAMKTLDRYAWTHQWSDTGASNPSAHLIPSAITLGRVCSARFTVQQTPPNELQSLFELSIMTDQVAQAEQVLARRLTLVKSRLDSAQVLFETFQSYLDVVPQHLDSAKATLGRLDALGPEVASVRVLAYGALISSRWRSEDTASTRLAINGGTAAWTATTASFKSDFSDGGGASGLLLWAPLQLAESEAKPWHELLRIWRVHGKEVVQLTGRPFQDLPDDSTQLPPVYRLGVTHETAPPLTGTFWYNTHGNTVWPMPGKVTIVVPVDSALAGPNNYREYAMLRRLREKYGDALEIVLATHTEGFDFTGKVALQHEAETLRWYFLDYLKLPFTVLVDEASFTTDSHGVHHPRPVQFQREYPGLTVVDPQGHVVWVRSIMFPAFEARLDNIIQAALTKTSQHH